MERETQPQVGRQDFFTKVSIKVLVLRIYGDLLWLTNETNNTTEIEVNDWNKQLTQRSMHEYVLIKDMKNPY